MSKHSRTRTSHRRDLGIPDELQQATLHPVLKRIYANRHISSLDQVDYSLGRLLNFNELKGIDTAANIVADAITVVQQPAWRFGRMATLTGTRLKRNAAVRRLGIILLNDCDGLFVRIN